MWAFMSGCLHPLKTQTKHQAPHSSSQTNEGLQWNWEGTEMEENMKHYEEREEEKERIKMKREKNERMKCGGGGRGVLECMWKEKGKVKKRNVLGF